MSAAPAETSKQSPPRHTVLLSLRSLGLLPDKLERDVTPELAWRQGSGDPGAASGGQSKCPLCPMDAQTELYYMQDPRNSPAFIQGALWEL